MPVRDWRPGDKPRSPVYIDSNIVAASFVRKDRRYQPATQLLGDLLLESSELVISSLVVSESLWGLAKMSYHEVRNQPFHLAFHPQIFYNNCELIFERFRARMGSVHEWIREWRSAGIQLTLIPMEMDALQEISQRIPVYMEAYKMASADALHLAAAEMQAQSFVTGDEGFRRASASSLEIYYVPKPTA